MKKILLLVVVAMFCVFILGGCKTQTSDGQKEPEIYFNGKPLVLSDEGNIDLDLLSVENGITVSVESDDLHTVTVNGKIVDDGVFIDVYSITRDGVVEIEITDENGTEDYTVNLMPSTFKDYTTEGVSTTAGDYYMSTYDEQTNYIFKLNNSGELIFYKKTDDNALDFRKEYNSDGEVRYTYMPYLEATFCGISGINPGCVVVMDADYNVIDEIYYQKQDGSEMKIDPHGFIYIDDGHYILTGYEDDVVNDIPEELGASYNTAYLAVLYIQEIKDGEVVWEFCSKDYPEFLYATTDVTWASSNDACYDYVHFNSMYIDGDDNLLVSCRNINSILKISREDGSLMWTLGGKNDEFGLTDEQIFSKQHSIIVTEDGSYMLFNNANDEVASGDAEYSSIIRLKVDEQSKTVTEYTEYETGFFSNYMGAIRQIDADNSIYLWSVGGNYLGLVPEYSMIEYSETDGEIFKFRFNDGQRRLYCANKCE